MSCVARAPQYESGAPAQAQARLAPGVIEVQGDPLPSPERVGDSREHVLQLRAPLGSELARSTVRAFLRAAVDEKPERVELLLSPDAFVDTGTGRQPARSFWHSRMAQLDYTELKGQRLFRDGDVQTFRAEDLQKLPAERRIPIEVTPDDVFVRVPIRISWAGRPRLFGDELLFRLQPAGSHFEISEITEDFRLP